MTHPHSTYSLKVGVFTSPRTDMSPSPPYMLHTSTLPLPTLQHRHLLITISSRFSYTAIFLHINPVSLSVCLPPLLLPWVAVG